MTARWGEGSALFLFAIAGRGGGWWSRKLPRRQARFIEMYRVIEGVVSIPAGRENGYILSDAIHDVAPLMEGFGVIDCNVVDLNHGESILSRRSIYDTVVYLYYILY